MNVEHVPGDEIDEPPRHTRNQLRPKRASPAIARRATDLVKRGFSLAERGAYYSARAQFIQALRLVAQSLDVQDGSQRHTAAIASGLRAMKEAKDFAPRGSQLEADLNLEIIVSAHRTPTLKAVRLDEITPLIALQRYFTFAEDCLATAVGNEPAGSKALFGLAKLQEKLNDQNSGDPLVGPKAMTLYQTAMTCDRRNYMAANELGVLFARYGQLEDAKQVLKECVRVAARPEAWHNLAVVHEKLGEPELAQLAQRERQIVSKSEPQEDYAGLEPTIQWVHPSAFSKSAAVDHIAAQPIAVKLPPQQTLPPSKPARQANKSTFGLPSFRSWTKR